MHRCQNPVQVPLFGLGLEVKFFGGINFRSLLFSSSSSSSGWSGFSRNLAMSSSKSFRYFRSFWRIDVKDLL